jgi:pimeloyl-ACP methyl ester carboxylesterase
MRIRVFSTIVLFVLAGASAAFVQGAKPESKWAKLDGNKIHYYDIGNAKADEALVLIHGWTCNADFWKGSLNAFPEYRVIALDLPGHGKSDKPKVDYSMAYFARAVDAVMKEAGVRRGVFAGHSMGTPIARELYRMHPDKTKGIVIVDGALRPFFPKAMADQLIGEMKADYKASSAQFVDNMAMVIKDEALRKYVRETMLSAPDYVAISAMEGMADEKIWRADKINVPVLAVMAQSPFWPPDVKEIFTSIAPGIDFQMWTGVSHFLQMEKPKEFNDEVRAFILKNKLL